MYISGLRRDFREDCFQFGEMRGEAFFAAKGNAVAVGFCLGVVDGNG